MLTDGSIDTIHYRVSNCESCLIGCFVVKLDSDRTGVNTRIDTRPLKSHVLNDHIGRILNLQNAIRTIREHNARSRCASNDNRIARGSTPSQQQVVHIVCPILKLDHISRVEAVEHCLNGGGRRTGVNSLCGCASRSRQRSSTEGCNFHV